MLTLRPVKQFTYPVTAECITPDAFESKNTTEIGELGIWEGNKQRKLSDLFSISAVKDPEPCKGTAIEIVGDVAQVRKIGFRMHSGEIRINGSAGMHLGEEMEDGRIIVHGNVGSWAGSMMKGGTIDIDGNAGDYLGAPYRGSPKGMNGGKITVRGNTGNETGARMKKGIIKIYGCSGQFSGLRMHDGTIYIQRDSGDRAGACMVDGRIIIGGNLPSVLPTFTIDSIKPRVRVDEDQMVQETFYLFLGDLTESGRGKLYVSMQKNPQLASYEKFL